MAFTDLEGLLVLTLVGLVCTALAARTRLNAGLLPLPVLAGSVVWLTVCGMLGVLRPGGYALFAAGVVYVAFELLAARHPDALPDAGQSRFDMNCRRMARALLDAPALWLFLLCGAGIWLLMMAQKPMFLRWDEFSFWGTACRMTKENHMLHPGAPGNLTARSYPPAMMVLAYLFQFFSEGFSEWKCLAAYDLLALAAFAAFAAFPAKRWHLAVLGMLGAGLLPYFFLAPGDSQASTVYLNAMGDIYLGLVFGGALCLYFRAWGGKAGFACTALTLLCLTFVKDMGFAYALIAAALMALDLFLAAERPGLRSFGGAAAAGLGLAVPVLAGFVAWSRYVLAASGIDKGAGVGAQGSQVGYGYMLTDGVLQFLGRGGETHAEKFAQVKASMFAALTGTPLCLVGGTLAAAALCLGVLALAFGLAWPGAARRRAVCLAAGGLGAFAVFWLFHLLLYVYSFSAKEAALLKDYDRYIGPYLMGWLLAALCVLGLCGQSGRRWKAAQAASGLGVLALAAVVALRGLPAQGFWNVNRSNYAIRQDVAARAQLVAGDLDWEDTVLLISQGDDATRWYYYCYALNAVMGYGWGGDGYKEGDNHWVSTFMNLVYPGEDQDGRAFYAFQEQYPDQARCGPIDLTLFLREKQYDYILLDQSDKYIRYGLVDLFTEQAPLECSDAAYLYRIVDDGGEYVRLEPAGEVRYVPQTD